MQIDRLQGLSPIHVALAFVLKFAYLQRLLSHDSFSGSFEAGQLYVQALPRRAARYHVSPREFLAREFGVVVVDFRNRASMRADAQTERGLTCFAHTAC